VGLVAGFATHRGLVRQTNEDSFLVRKGLYVVCDGMGGARGGEVASQMACERLLTIVPATAGKEELREAIVDANDNIAARSVAEPNLLGMGTTLTSALVRDGAVILGHVGDSRAYLLHEGALRQLTDDHSWVGEMVRRGELTAAEAAVHPHRSVITRALGTDGEVEPDLLEAGLASGDRLMLCSDGLSGMVMDEKIQEILARPGDPQEAADALVQAALEAGGEDNVTVLVVDLVADDQGDGAAAAAADTVSGGGGAGEAGTDQGADDAVPVGDDSYTIGPADRGVERASSVPGFMRPALGMGARLSRRPPLWARQTPADSQAAASTAETTHRWSRRKWILTVAVVVVVLALAVAAFAVFNSNVYYVGTSNGMVALYQGLPATLLGIKLSSVVEQGTVRYDSLAAYQQERVDAHDLVGKEAGQTFLRGLATLQ
jgi:PPM family protein phosphatase